MASSPSSAAPGDGAGSSSVSAHPAGQPSAPDPFPSPDSFGWDDWDGAVDKLPEPVRGWGGKLSERYAKTAEDARAEARFAQETYEKLLKGETDPRLEKLERDLAAKLKELEGFQGSSKELQTKLEAAEARAKEYEAAWAKYQDDQATAFADNFAKQHPWMFDDGPVQELASQLLDDGFALDDLPVVLRLPDVTLERARVLVKEMKGAQNAGQHAVRVARSEMGIQKSPAADLVASGSRVAAAAADIQPKQGESMSDRLSRTIELELRKRA